MKKFLIKSALFLSPLTLLIIGEYIIDPYYLFHDSGNCSKELYEIGYSYDQGRRYKTFRYLKKENNTDKIIMGSSQINVLTEDIIPEKGWMSLSFGGVHLKETLDMFMNLVDKERVNKVLLAPEFVSYCAAVSDENDNYRWSTSSIYQVEDEFNDKASYFIDKCVFQASFSYLVSLLGGDNSRGVPQTSKDEFWKEQLDYCNKMFTASVVEIQRKQVTDMFTDFKREADRNGINVIVVIPAQHLDIIKMEYSEGIFSQYASYLEFLVNTFNNVYYFDYPNSVTNNKDFFGDPMHCNNAQIYISSLWPQNDTDEYEGIKLTKDNICEILETVRNSIN